MKAEELKKIAKRYAQDELKDNHSAVEDVVAAAFLNGIDYAEHHPHWISVEDELPPIRQGVIAYNGVTSRKAWVLEDGSWIADTHKEWERNCFKQYPVTHWMPLPEPVVSKTENTILKGGKV